MQDEFRDKAGSDLFARKLALAKALFASLEDKEANFSGRRVLARLIRHGLTFEPAGPNQKGIASYHPFDPIEDHSYLNMITCPVVNTDGSERSDIGFCGSTFHELIHADSWDRVPELHASPFNKNTPIILCPEDFALMTAITERVAYDNMAWLLSLAQKKRSDVGHIVTPVNALMFDFIRAREGKLSRALALAGDLSARVSWGVDDRDNTDITMEQYYHKAALIDYNAQVEARAVIHDLPLVVRLEPHNIRALAQSFGPNILKEGQMPMPLRDLDRKLVSEIYDTLFDMATVPAYDKLPTFDEGLKRFGYTPSSFMDMSKTAGLVPETVRPHLRRMYPQPDGVPSAGGGFSGLVSFPVAAAAPAMAPA